MFPNAAKAVVLAVAGIMLATLFPSPAAAGLERWTTGGPPGGTVRAIEIRPGDPSRMLAAAGAGGIFHSEDGGSSWRRADGLPRDSMAFAISYAPSDPDVVYAGTNVAGAQRSDDGGRTWRQVYAENTVWDIEPDPTDSEFVFLVTGPWTYWSDDGGDTWNEVDFAGGLRHFEVVAAAPSQPGRFYFAGVGQVHRTDDWGASWPSDEFATPTTPTFEDLAVDPGDPDRLFGITRSEGVWRSTDAGDTWNPVSDGLPMTEGGNFLPVLSIAMHPDDPDTLYVGADRAGKLFRTRDGGESWQRVQTGLSRHGVNRISIDATDGDRLFAGFVHDGLAVTDDAGATWKRSDAGLVGSDVKSLLAMPGNGRTVLAGTVGQGVFRSTDGGASWQRSGLRSQDVLGLASSASGGSIYAAASDGLYRTRDGGRSWSRVGGLKAPFLSDVAVSPVDSRYVYAIQFHHAYGSRDSGASWELLREGTWMSLHAHPTRARTVYLGARGALLRSTDAGGSWANLHEEFHWHFDVRDIAVDPERPRIIYAAMSPGGLLRSRDGGDSWRQAAAAHLDLIDRAQAVVIDPSNPARVYAAGFDVLNGGAVLRSSARNSGWSVVSRSGLTTSWIASLAVSSGGTRLYAGTTGYGLDDGGGAFSWRYR